MSHGAVQRRTYDVARFFDFAADLFSVTSVDGYFKLINPAWEVTLGYSKAELLSKPFLSFVHPDDQAATWIEVEGFVKNGRSSFTFENRYRAKDGSYRWLQWRPVDSHDDVVYAIARDVTDRKLADEKLRESEARHARAQSIARLGHWEEDLATGTLYWSDEVFRIFDIPAPSRPLTKEDFFRHVHADDHAAIRGALKRTLETGCEYNIDHRIVRPGGEVRHVHEHAEVIYDVSGSVVRFVGTVQDITEYKLLEERLLQSQKMEAVGRLAGGVAHDFNNLLTMIIGYGELLVSALDQRPELKKYAEEALHAADRAAALTQQLLALSRRQVIQPKVVDLNALVTRMETLLRRLAGENIALTTKLDPAPGCVRADPVQIEQVILNLAVNARDAMPQGGQLTLETANVLLPRDDTAAGRALAPGAYVMLAVRDTGIGMDSETMLRVFEPFFTTKGIGEGTGLGLSTVYGIVKQSNGEIFVESKPGRGAIFRVYLPRTAESGEPVTTVRTVSGASQGTETILLAEDEVGVRNLVTETLRRHGYQVLAANDPEEALRVARTHTHPIHLLVTDVIMPRMNGKQLADQVAALRPSIRVLYISGYHDDMIPLSGRPDGQVHFLRKPFTPAVLTRLIRDVLAR
jgi:PAS domain S-box-containing protein